MEKAHMESAPSPDILFVWYMGLVQVNFQQPMGALYTALLFLGIIYFSDHMT
jgi:hypothetical protein